MSGVGCWQRVKVNFLALKQAIDDDFGGFNHRFLYSLLREFQSYDHTESSNDAAIPLDPWSSDMVISVHGIDPEYKAEQLQKFDVQRYVHAAMSLP